MIPWAAQVGHGPWPEKLLLVVKAAVVNHLASLETLEAFSHLQKSALTGTGGLSQ